jgi:hypothetical protein
VSQHNSRMSVAPKPNQERRRWRPSNGTALCLAILGIALLVTASLMPVTAYEASPKLLSTSGASAFNTASSSSITIINRGPARVQIQRASLNSPEDGNGLTPPLTGFEGRYINPAASATISGAYSMLNLDLTAGPPGARVTIRRSDGGSLSSENATLQPYQTTKLHVSPSLTQPVVVPLFEWVVRCFDSSTQLTCESIAEKSLVNKDAPQYGLLSKTIAETVAAMLLRLGAILLVLLGLALAYAIGLSLDPDTSPSKRRFVARVAVGLLLPLLIANSLTYVVDAPLAYLSSIGAVVCAATGYRFFRNTRAHSRTKRTGTASSVRASILAHFSVGIGFRETILVVTASILMFSSILNKGFAYAGEFKTDYFEYTTLVSFLQHQSLLSIRNDPIAAASGLITSGAGFEWRSIDSVGAAIIANISGMSSSSSLAAFSILMFMFLAISVMNASQQVGGGFGSSTVGFAVLLFPVTLAVFLEGYQSHFVFLCAIPAYLALVALSNTSGDDKEGYRRYLLLSACCVTAFLIAIYPYFAVLMLAASGAFSLLNRRHRTRRVITFFSTCVGAIILTNVGLIPAFLYTRNIKFQESLNAIAKGVLLGPFDYAQRVGLGAGVVSFEWRQADSPLYSSDSAWIYFLDKLNNVNTQILAMIILIVVLPIIVTLILPMTRRRSRNDPRYILILCTLAIWTGFTGVLVLQGEIYAAFKALTTEAVIAVFALAFVPLSNRSTKLLSVAVLPMAIIWLGTGQQDRITSQASPGSRMALASHSSSIDSLEIARRFFETHPGTVALTLGAQALSGSDRDRVLSAHVQSMLRDEKRTCLNCVGLPAPGPGDLCLDKADYLITIGRGLADQNCRGRKPVLETQFITVYR